MLERLCSLVTVTGADHEKVLEAIRFHDFHDFEDCIQTKCAEQIQADCIVTRNAKDFARSSISVLEPSEFLNMFYRQED